MTRGSKKPTSTSKRYVVLCWAVVVAWACFIFFASAHTGDNLNNAQDFLGQIKRVIDSALATLSIPGLKESSSLGHFCEYTIFGALLCNALRNHVRLAPAAVVAAIVIASAYGVTDEFHQLFVPGRACDPADWVVDTLGATLGSCLLWAFVRVHR